MGEEMNFVVNPRETTGGSMKIVFKERFGRLLKKSVSRIKVEKGGDLSPSEITEIQQALKLHLDEKGFFLMMDTEKPSHSNKKKRTKSNKRVSQPQKNKTLGQSNWLSSERIF